MPSARRHRARYLALSIVLLLIVAALLLFLLSDAPPPADGASDPLGPTATEDPRATPLSALDRDSRPTHEESSRATDDALAAKAIAERAHIAGKVIDLAGDPLGGIPICTREISAPFATADSLGRFRAEVQLQPGARLIVGTSAYVTVGEAEYRSGITDYVIVAAPAIEVGGVVVDPSGAPLEDVELKIEIPSRLLRALPVTDATHYGRWIVHSDAEGRFHFPSAPAFPGAVLRARKGGYATRRQDLEPYSALDLRIVLAPRGETNPTDDITGIVIDEAGTRIPGATVRFASASTGTNENGAFSLDRRSAPGEPLLAYKVGYAPAVVEGFGDRVAETEGPLDPLDPVELVLGAMAEIEGLLVDANGQPCPGWKIQLLDGVHAGILPTSNSPNLPGHFTPTGPTSVEELASGERGERETDEAGRFHFEGLRPHHEYRLRTYHEETLQIAVSDPIPSDTVGYLFRLPPVETRPVHGVVVNRFHEPLADVRIRLTMNVHRMDDGGRWMHTGEEVRTGPDGRFRFEEVPPSDLSLRFNGDHVMSHEVDLPPEHIGRDLEVVLAQMRRVQLTNESGEVGAIAVEDLEGERLRLHVWHGEGQSSSSRSASVRNGQSPIVEVSDVGAVLVLLHAGEEIGRLPISWDPDPERITAMRY